MSTLIQPATVVLTSNAELISVSIPQSNPPGSFIGSVVTSVGYIYPEGVVDINNPIPGSNYGIVKIGDHFEPEFPDQVIGTFQLKLVDYNKTFDAAGAAYLAQNIPLYLAESEAIANKITGSIEITMIFSGSPEFDVNTTNTIHAYGILPWGVRGQKFVMNIEGTGPNIGQERQAVVYRVNVLNISGGQVFTMDLPYLKLNA